MQESTTSVGPEPAGARSNAEDATLALTPIDDNTYAAPTKRKSKVREQRTLEVPERAGLSMSRRWTKPGVDPFDQVEWERRSAVITGEGGKVVFEQRDVEVPATWSQLATNVVVSKYFRGTLGTPERETSVRQLIGRVVDTIAGWAEKDGYFSTDGGWRAFRDELKYLLLHQYAAFNSPVWFNVGVEARPQCSACFINSVEDTMESILELCKTEGRLFKYGSGTGTNFSPLRGSKERAGRRRSGIGSGELHEGLRRLRRRDQERRQDPARRQDGHPRRRPSRHRRFHQLQGQRGEEGLGAHRCRATTAAIDGEAYSSVFFQNSNNSVRVTDEFMRAVENDGVWKTLNRPMAPWPARTRRSTSCDSSPRRPTPAAIQACSSTPPSTSGTPARPATAFYASNPCSEYMFLNDSACNLASLNLMKFRDAAGEFDVEAFKHAVDVVITAQEVIVDNASYPTDRIRQELLSLSPAGPGLRQPRRACSWRAACPTTRTKAGAYAAAVTALMSGEAYAQSARMAQVKGPFKGYAANGESMRDVMQMHRDGRRRASTQAACRAGLLDAARRCVGRGAAAWARQHGLPQRPDHGAGAHRHHRLHDGLRHHRHRARYLAHQVQEAGRWRHA